MARVFDDMLERSVPMYEECQDLAIRWCVKYTQSSTHIYDLGCSTGSFLIKLAKTFKPHANIKLIGVDNSQAMLKKAAEVLKNSPLPCELVEENLNENLNIINASVVVLNYTLQFVQPENRAPVLQNIFNGLTPGGSLVLIEKVKSEVPELNNTFTELHHQFKEQKGYSKLEISQKREALENVLIPWTMNENNNLLNSVGFSKVDLFFKWNNFAGFIALK